jgi:quinoprotein glucose dehydrogenase
MMNRKAGIVFSLVTQHGGGALRQGRGARASLRPCESLSGGNSLNIRAMGEATRPQSMFALFVISCMVLASLTASSQVSGDTEWPNYGNDAGGMRYSPLSQINRENVQRLKTAWVFHTGDISDGSRDRKRSGFEATPILVDGTLYFTTPFNRVIALDPETGKQRWAYDPMIDQTLDYGDGLVNRGVATWLDPARSSSLPCRRRIYEARQDARLVSLDATTGKPCLDFGNYGQVNLRDVPGYRAGWYHMTSPPAVIDDLVVIGSAIDDNQRAVMPAGVVRAFDVRTGYAAMELGPDSRHRRRGHGEGRG